MIWTACLVLAKHGDYSDLPALLAHPGGTVRHAERYLDQRLAAYGAGTAHISEMRQRFAQWREQLAANLP